MNKVGMQLHSQTLIFERHLNTSWNITSMVYKEMDRSRVLREMVGVLQLPENTGGCDVAQVKADLRSYKIIDILS